MWLHTISTTQTCSLLPIRWHRSTLLELGGGEPPVLKQPSHVLSPLGQTCIVSHIKSCQVQNSHNPEQIFWFWTSLSLHEEFWVLKFLKQKSAVQPQQITIHNMLNEGPFFLVCFGSHPDSTGIWWSLCECSFVEEWMKHGNMEEYKTAKTKWRIQIYLNKLPQETQDISYITQESRFLSEAQTM